jgi:plasmid stabilization system protein ParE
MGARVGVTAQAWNDLSGMIDYVTSKRNAVEAGKLCDHLLDAALALEKAPLIGCPIKGPAKARLMIRGKYLIFYRVESDRKRLLILRFWHSARDLKKLRLEV